MANHMEAIAKELGLELGEEFKVTLDKGITEGNYKYKFEDTGLQGFNEDNADAGWYHAVSTFDRIVRDDSIIIKLPFKPKDDEVYWYIWRVTEDKMLYNPRRWFGDIDDLMRFKTGNCFRSKEEVEKNKYRFYKELTQGMIK